jgi:hypothetical protein
MEVRPAQPGTADLNNNVERSRDHRISDLFDDRTLPICVQSDSLHFLITLSIAVTQLMTYQFRSIL